MTEKIEMPKGYWWCPSCKEEKSGHHVTFGENCSDCGTRVLSKSVEPCTDELMDDLPAASIVRDMWQGEFERRFKELREKLANK